MKTYDEFLTWAAEYHYNRWMMDTEGTEVAWGGLSHSVINTASAIYGHPHFDIYHAFKARLEQLYGNPLTGKNGSLQACGLVPLW